MSRLVDATICPDCRTTLDASATCPACGLRLTGSLAADLWRLMVDADRVVEQLRALSGPVSAAMTPPVASLPPFPTTPTPAPPRQRRLPAASVQVVLLSLGALCLLVAAVVFVAVTWSLLGLTGRTLVLLGFTGLLALVAVALTRQDLRGAAETFWIVVAGMLTVDLLGAQSAGLAGLDALDWRGTGALVGGALLATGLGVGVWARRQPVGRLYGAESVAVVGALIVCTSNVWLAENPAVAATVAVPVLAALFALLRRQVPVAAYGMGGLALASWLVLLLVGWERTLETAGLGEWWSDGRGWPLLAAAVLAAVTVYLPTTPAQARPVAAGLGLLALALLAGGPQTVGTETRDIVVASTILVALALVAAFAPRTWALGAAALAALGVVGLGLWLAAGPSNALASLEPDGSTSADTVLSGSAFGAAPWTAGIVALAVASSLVLLLRRVPERHRASAGPSVGAVAPAVLALGALVLVLGLQPPLWVGVLAAAVATAIAAGATWWVRDHSVAAASGTTTTAYLAALTLYTAAANDLLIAVTTSIFAVVLVVVLVLRDLAGRHFSAAASGALAALVGGWALVAWGVELGADADARGLALALYAALVGVIASPATRHEAPRITLEVTAMVLAVTAVVAIPDPHTSAMAMTAVGSAICLVAVANRDRAQLGWLGAVILGLATAVRAALDVQAPELYTLPAATLLIAAGAWRLRTDREASSFDVLGSGLTLALLPSLVLALDEPVSLRGALIGAAGVLALAVGVHQRLAAPFVLGAATTGLLAVRHLEPYADAVPRWITLGGVGLALLVVGVTWEARRRNLETAGRYLAALR